MKAAQINMYGGPEVIEILENTPEPTLHNDQVLVQIYAAALNPFDAKIRSGIYKHMMPLQFPATLGGDFSGVVTKIGKNVTEYAVGDEVFGTALVITGGSGAFAEFSAVIKKNMAHKPKNVTHTESASLVLVGASAIQALEKHINLQSGQKILIHGGAGGIGTAAIQLAKAKGAYVAATASADSKNFVKSLGADEVIDYKNEKFEEKLHEYDAVYDTVGGEVAERSFLVLKKGGILVSMMGQPDEERAKELGITGIGQMTQSNNKHFTRLSELIENGSIKPKIDREFSLDEVTQAFVFLEKGHPRGKVVLKIY